MPTLPKNLTVINLTKGRAVDRYQLEALEYAMRMAKALGEDIPGLLVSSGYRDIEAQERLYKLYLAGKGNIAAKPGASWHHYQRDGQTTKGAIDFTSKSMDTTELQAKIVDALRKRKIKFHTCLKERSCVHVQFLYGGGEKNRGVVK